MTTIDVVLLIVMAIPFAMLVGMILVPEVWTKWRSKKNIAELTEIGQWLRFAQFRDTGIHRSELAVTLNGQDLAILNGIPQDEGATKEHIKFSQLLQAGVSQTGCRAISRRFDLGNEANEFWLRYHRTPKRL